MDFNINTVRYATVRAEEIQEILFSEHYADTYIEFKNKQYDKIPKTRIVTTSKKCMICLDFYQKGDIFPKLSCKHMFHVECLRKWFYVNTTCPECRGDILDIVKKEKFAKELFMYLKAVTNQENFEKKEKKRKNNCVIF